MRASKKLRSDEALLVSFAGTSLRQEIDRVPLWRGDSVAIKQLAEDFARYYYLPRLKDTSVLLNAIEDGLGLMLWRQDGFALADSFDEVAKRYRGLRTGQRSVITDANMSALLVRPEIAENQMLEEAPVTPSAGEQQDGPGQPVTGGGSLDPQPPLPPTGPVQRKRFHGVVSLDPTRVGRDAGRIAEEVIAHLAGLSGATVIVTLEIDAAIPDGAPDEIVRTVTENSHQLKFTNHGFENE